MNLNKKGFIGTTILLIVSIVLFILLLVISFSYEKIQEMKFNRDVEKYKEVAFDYMRQLEDDIEIIDENKIFYLDFNTGNAKEYILIGKTMDGMIVSVEMDFEIFSKENDYYISTDYIENKVTELILEDVYQHTDVRYSTDLKDNNAVYAQYNEYKLNQENEQYQSLLDLYSEDIVKKAKLDEMTVGEYLELNYREFIKEQNVDFIELRLRLSQNDFTDELENLTEEEIRKMVNDIVDFYKAFKKEYDDIDLKISLNYTNFIYQLDLNDVDNEKEKFIQQLLEEKRELKKLFKEGDK